MIYFLQAQNGLIKIGYSKNVGRRVREICQMSPVSLELLGTEAGGFERERLLHSVFSRSHGEWFYPDIDFTNRPKIRVGNSPKVIDSKRLDGNWDAKCKIWSLDESELKEGKLVVDPDSRKTIVLQDIDSGRLIKASEISIPIQEGGRLLTRGVTLTDTTGESQAWGSPSQVEKVKRHINELAELFHVSVKSIPVITLTVENLKLNGNDISIEEFVPGKRGYNLTKNIVVSWND